MRAPWSFVCFSIVFNVAVRAIRAVCQVSSCLEHTLLRSRLSEFSKHWRVLQGAFLTVQWLVCCFHAVSCFTLALVLRRDPVPAAPKIPEVLHGRALVKSSACLGTHDFAGSALGNGGWRDRRCIATNARGLTCRHSALRRASSAMLQEPRVKLTHEIVW